MLTDAEIAAVLETGGSLDETCHRLISEANERGGNDNISVVLIRPRSSNSAEPS
jgi:serine/threonine protein phosphatase PrpC